MEITKTFTETLLFAAVATNAALLMFFAGVFRKMMNDADVATFKDLTASLVHYSSKSPFMIIVLNLPLIIAIPYYYFYGFENWWLNAGLALWLIAGSIAKMLKLPVYKAIGSLKNEDTALLTNMRSKLNTGNAFQAILYCVAVILLGLGIV